MIKKEVRLQKLLTTFTDVFTTLLAIYTAKTLREAGILGLGPLHEDSNLLLHGYMLLALQIILF
ncbi:MAG: hypothetical protein D6767_07040, partial [Candidatus Hydrogenedentota bacterium]